MAEKGKKRAPEQKGTVKPVGGSLQTQMEAARKIAEHTRESKKLKAVNKLRTGIEGLDKLFAEGIPVGSSVLIAGGPGTGKTILCLQVVYNAVKNGKKCLYMSFEEPEVNLEQHMRDFGWEPEEYQKKGLLRIKRFNTLDIARSIEALLSEAKKELLIDIQPVLIPKGFEPEIIVLDSLSAISSAFSGERSRYRIYIEQLFRFLEKSNITSFLITETTHPESLGLTESGIEGFLADGIIVLYNVAHEGRGTRNFGIEILKMRGEEISKKIVSMDIVSGKGLVVHPDRTLLTDGEFKHQSTGSPV